VKKERAVAREASVLFAFAVSMLASGCEVESEFRVKIMSKEGPGATSTRVAKDTGDEPDGLYKTLPSGVVYGVQYTYVESTADGPVYALKIWKGKDLQNLAQIRNPGRVVFDDPKETVFENDEVQILFHKDAVKQ
jgi:hypothetical protein